MKELEQEKHIESIITSAVALGWQIAIPNDEEEVVGFVVGTSEYISKVLGDKDVY